MVLDRLLAERQAKQGRAAQERQERARTSRQAVADTKALLSDLNAQRYTFSFHPEESPARLTQLEERWHDVRLALANAEVAAQPKLRQALSELETNIAATFHWLKWWTADKRVQRDDRNALNHALESYNAARSSLHTCVELLDEVGE